MASVSQPQCIIQSEHLIGKSWARGLQEDEFAKKYKQNFLQHLLMRSLIKLSVSILLCQAYVMLCQMKHLFKEVWVFAVGKGQKRLLDRASPAA